MTIRKKLLAIVLSIAMLCGLVPGMALAAETGDYNTDAREAFTELRGHEANGGTSSILQNGENLLQNPSFESGLSGWTDPDNMWTAGLSNGGFCNYSAVDGKYLIWAKEEREKDICLYQEVALNGHNPGEMVELSAQYRNGSPFPPDNSKIVLKFLDVAGNVLREYSQQSTRGIWDRLTVAVLLPSGAAKARVELWTINLGRCVCYDDISLKFSGGIVIPENGENLLQNPSFESGLSGWAGWAEMDNAWAAGPSGGFSNLSAVHGEFLMWAKSGREKDIYVYQDAALNGHNPGEVLELSAQTNNGSPFPPDSSKIVLKFLDAAGNVLKEYSQQGTDGKWARYTVSGPIPGGAVKARAELWALARGDVYYDDVSLKVLGGTSPVINNQNSLSSTAPTPDNAVPVTVTGGKNQATTSVFNGVTGVTVSFRTSGVIGYRLYRSESADSLGISVTDFYITANNFTDVNVEPNTTYYYTLKEVLAEADPLNGKREQIGDVLATWTVKTAGTVGHGFADTSKTRHFIMLKIDDPKMSVDGEAKEVDPGRGTAPIILRGRTMVPIRSIVEAMGGNVGWEQGSREVSLKVSSIDVRMWVDKNELTKNSTKSKIDVAPSIINNRTFVPLRFGTENLDCQVDWINSTKSIVIVWSE